MEMLGITCFWIKRKFIGLFKKVTSKFLFIAYDVWEQPEKAD
jgi:hypothetical protein